MKSEDFVKRIASLPHSAKYFMAKGYDGSEAEFLSKEEKRTFSLRAKQPETTETSDAVEDLICRYDCSDLEIGIVVLGKKELPFSAGTDKVVVGLMEADPIVINKTSGEIELLDHAQPDFVMAKCALSGERLLDALFLVASFEPPYFDLLGNLPEEKQHVNNKAALATARECAEAAGIAKERNIYEMILGCY